MNSEYPIPAIPKGRPISWEDWLAGRRSRRETGNRVAPGIIRRAAGPADGRLRRLFRGERGLSFKPTSEL